MEAFGSAAYCGQDHRERLQGTSGAAGPRLFTGYGVFGANENETHLTADIRKCSAAPIQAAGRITADRCCSFECECARRGVSEGIKDAVHPRWWLAEITIHWMAGFLTGRQISRFTSAQAQWTSGPLATTVAFVPALVIENGKVVVEIDVRVRIKYRCARSSAG